MKTYRKFKIEVVKDESPREEDGFEAYLYNQSGLVYITTFWGKTQEIALSKAKAYVDECYHKINEV
jgi:hypothetical protein